ncbi:MAG: type II toxin-antitoxin system HicB family antitoxin [Rhizobiaceae bacterium]|nr:type II toxin-antitoxin system HicB family antitoxin [Rhizobiaceae bacterium]
MRRDYTTLIARHRATLAAIFADPVRASALSQSIDDYIAFCAERGDDPEKLFSGQFVVRAEPDLHRALVAAARRSGMSLNKLVTTTLPQISRRLIARPCCPRAAEWLGAAGFVRPPPPSSSRRTDAPRRRRRTGRRASSSRIR